MTKDEFLNHLAVTHPVILEQELTEETEEWKIEFLKKQIKEDYENAEMLFGEEK